MKKIVVLVLGLLFLSSSVFAVSLTPADVIAKIRDNQNKIQDLSAQITTTIKSDKEKKSMEQKGVIMVKGNDKSRMEMLSPMAQLTVTNGDKMMITNPATGKKFGKQTGQSDVGQNPLDQTKILDSLNLSMEEKGFFFKSYVITGTPKKQNAMMGKIKFYVDGGKFVPTKLEIYNSQDKLVTASDINYTKIKDIWVISQNSSWIDVPGGKVTISMKFSDVKVNEGIDDKVFEIK